MWCHPFRTHRAAMPLCCSAHGNFAMYNNLYDSRTAAPPPTVQRVRVSASAVRGGAAAHAVASPAVRAVASPAVRAVASPAVQTITAPARWRCATCTLDNLGSNTECEACRTARPAQTPQPVAASHLAAAQRARGADKHRSRSLGAVPEGNPVR